LNDSNATPEESLENSYQVLRDALSHDVLEAIKNGTPAAFEQIVVDLLVAMGYGGSVEDAGRVVGKSGDAASTASSNRTSWVWMRSTYRRSGGRMLWVVRRS
jgi:restriction endonuclease Mrr